MLRSKGLSTCVTLYISVVRKCVLEFSIVGGEYSSFSELQASFIGVECPAPSADFAEASGVMIGQGNISA